MSQSIWKWQILYTFGTRTVKCTPEELVNVLAGPNTEEIVAIVRVELV